MGTTLETNLATILTAFGLGDANQQAKAVAEDPMVQTLNALSPGLGLVLGTYQGITKSNAVSNPMFRNAAPFSGEAPTVAKIDQDQWPTDSEGLMAVGMDLMNADDPFFAMLAFEKAGEADENNSLADYWYAYACVQQGPGCADRAVTSLDSYIEANPQDADGYALRAAANRLILSDFSPDTVEADELKEKILRDEAMSLALDEEGQLEQLQQVDDHLREITPDSPEDSQEVLDGLNLLAQRYLSMGTVPFDKDEDSELVRGEMNFLAGRTYEVMETFCYNSPYENIHARAPLYAALSTLAKGDLDGAEGQLKAIRKDFPEADTILTQMERDRLKSKNDAALAVWEDFISDGKAIELNQATGFMGVTCAFIEFTVTGGEEHVTDRVYQKWLLEQRLVTEVRDTLAKDPDATIMSALKTISESGSDDLKARAAKIIEESEAGMDNAGSYVLGHYLKLVSQDEADPELVQTVMHDLDQTEARYHVVRLPFDGYASLKGIVNDEDVQKELDERLKKLEGGKGFGDIVWDEIRTVGTDDLATLAIMGIAGRAGSATRLASFNYFVKGGMEARKAYALSYVAGVGAEGSTFWALNTVRQGWDHDLNDVMDPGRLAKSYVASLCMIGGAQGFSLLGNGTGRALAKSIGMVGEDGTLTLGGRAIVWGLQHGSSMGGMVGSNQALMTVGFVDAPEGGRGEAAIRDVFGYLKFALAPKLFKTLGFKEIPPPRLPEAVIQPRANDTTTVLEPDLSLARQSPARTESPAPTDPTEVTKVEVKGKKTSTDVNATAGSDEVTGVVPKNGSAAPSPAAAIEIPSNAESLLKVTLTSVEVEANVEAKGDPAKRVMMRPIRDAQTKELQAISVPDSLRGKVVEALKEKKLLDPAFVLPEGKEFIDVPVKKGRSITIWFEKPAEAAPVKTAAPAKTSSLLPENAPFAAMGPTLGVVLHHFGASPIVSTIVGIAGVAAMFLPTFGMVYNRSRIYSAPEPLRAPNKDVNLGYNKEGTLGWVSFGDRSGYAVRRNGAEQILINGKPLDPNTNWGWVTSGDVIKAGGKTYTFETGFEREPTSIKQGEREAARKFKLDENYRVMDGPAAAGVFKADAATDNDGRFVSVRSDDGRIVSVMVEGKGRSVGQSNAAVETEASLPGDINGGASLDTAILSARAHVEGPYLKEDGTIRAGAPKLNASGVEMEANPADPKKVKSKLVANGDIPLMIVRLGGGNQAEVLPQGVTEKELETGNDVVVAGRSIAPDAIAYIVKNTRPATAQAMLDNLQQEALIRAKILENKPQGGRLTAADYRAAYKSVTGMEAPQGWHGLYEGGFLAQNGKVYDGAGNPTGDSFSSTPGGFLVQIAGK